MSATTAPAEPDLSPVLAAFDRRQVLAECCPLYAIAMRAVAINEGRAEGDISESACIAALGQDARRALAAAGADVDHLLDLLYPK